MTRPRLEPSENLKFFPRIQLAAFIDVLFVTLFFFMTLSVFSQLETEISVSVPKAEESTDAGRSPGEIIINVDTQGAVIVNQRRLGLGELRQMLKRISSLYPNQPVIIRADKKTHHEDVVAVLDACAAAGIWNIAFATQKEG